LYCDIGHLPFERSKVLIVLWDLATFQTANGNERIYIMPYDSPVMWQLSFPMPEEEAKALSAQGTKALKEEACRRMAMTPSANFSGDLRSSGFWLSCL
jgi:hypothetical protein